MKGLTESQLGLSYSWTQAGTALQAFAPGVWAGQKFTPHSATHAQVVRAGGDKVKGQEREQSG